MPPIIEVDHLHKHFGDTHAVDDVTFAVEHGTVLGLLGPNGAGKTTTVRMLATLLTPDGGSARVGGHDVVADANTVRSDIGLTGQYAAVDEKLTGKENLWMVARLLGMSSADASSRAGELLERFELSDAADRAVSTYSGGMRRRTDLAVSLVGWPRVLFLDEPTTGLDPRSRNQVWDIVRELASTGTTVLLTTQYLDEADQLADRIAVIDNGRVIAEGTPGELKRSVGVGALHIRLQTPEQRAEAERLLSRTLGVAVQPGSDSAALKVRIPDPELVTRAFADLATANIAVNEFAYGQPSLDEVFLALTGHPAEEEAVTKEEVA